MIIALADSCGDCLFCAPILARGEPSWCLLQDYLRTGDDRSLSYAANRTKPPWWCPVAAEGIVLIGKTKAAARRDH
jgi:hypothetical protein